MIDFLLYLFKVTIIFSLVFVSYKLLLENTSFFKLNRVVLLTIVPFSFILPFIPISFPFGAENIDHSAYHKTEELVITTKNILETSTNEYYSNITLLFYAYLTFVLLYSCFRIITLIKILHFIRSSTVVYHQGYKIIRARTNTVYCVFSHIVLPIDYQINTNDPILEHEKAHIQYKHSFDLLFTELFIATMWFNPLVYKYRQALRNLHEYQADAAALAINTKKSSYLKLLLNQLDNQTNRVFTSSFNHKHLKKRIEMMTKSKAISSAIINYLFFSFSLLLIIFSFAFGLKHLPSQMPININKDVRIASEFGYRYHPILKDSFMHSGIDFIAPIGTAVMATANGEVIKAEQGENSNKKFGNYIVIQHPSGFTSHYAHLNAIKIKLGDKVVKGQLIGEVGETGFAINPHLHYEVHFKNEALNPRNYFE